MFKLDESPLAKSSENLAKVMAVLVRNYEVFYFNREYGRTTLVEHDIELISGTRPFRCTN